MISETTRAADTTIFVQTAAENGCSHSTRQNLKTRSRSEVNTMKLGTYTRITKREWIALGGLQNSRLFRRMRGGAWQYFMLH